MMQLSPPTPFDVLIVDDDAGDVLIIEEALATHGIGSTLHVVADGVGAMEFLRREGEHKNAPRPHLVLLDLNMPRKSGREVLEELKRDDDLASIPVVVLTTSSADEDILRSYDLHANAYVTKPVDFTEFEGVVVQIEQFYGQTAQLPGRRREV